MIQDMRKKEDDQFDDEMEAMRELENESNPLPAAKVGAEDGVPAQPLETDNDLEPLGNAGDTKDEGETHGQRKQWKKKGQKRTTKRVISEWTPCGCHSAANRPPSEASPYSTKEGFRYADPARG